MQNVITAGPEWDDGGKEPLQLRSVFKTFLDTLNAATIPVPDGRRVHDVPGAVLLSDHAQRLFNALGRERNRLTADGRKESIAADGSLELGGGLTVCVLESGNPSGPWRTVPKGAMRANALEITAKSARTWGILMRAQEVVSFLVQRWNEAQERKPGGPHQRYRAGDLITQADLDVLESVRQLLELSNDVPPADVDCQLKELAETPPFDRGSGLWVKNSIAAEIEGLETASLHTYRRKGLKMPDGSLGKDSDGRVWRRPGTPRSHPWYLRSSLKKKSG